jgi:hypothetical protein
MKCRCGHGRSWHRANPAAAARRRRLRLQPTGNLPCSFRMPNQVIRGRSGGWAKAGGKRDGGICRCRHYVAVEVDQPR